jgi:hypothetical protein
MPGHPALSPQASAPKCRCADKRAIRSITKDGKTLYLEAGDPIAEVVNAVHYGINQGKISAEIIVFYAGTVDMPVTVVEPR